MKRAAKVGRGRRWLGGYVRHEADGSETFIIERRISGKRFHVSTRCNNERAALEHLARFESNAASYSPSGVEPVAPVCITVELLSDYFDWCIEENNTPTYARSKVRFLGQWSEKLGAAFDLRNASIVAIKDALKKFKTSRPARIIALKAFYAWLRRERHLLKHAEDPTLEDLPVPQGAPEKHTRRKAADWDAVRAVYVRLTEEHRDVLQLFTATGWHVTELARFCRDERSEIELPPVRTVTPEGLEVRAVLRVWHKRKVWTRTSLVHQEHVDAARRLRSRGTFPNETRFREAIYAALEDANAARKQLGLAPFKRFGPGVMRHSVATWGVQLGATPERAAAHLEHADKSTTERFYVDLMVPTQNVPTRVLSGESLN
ncbi:MAG: hypothetical protein QM817_10475 [Archangium sp.]